MHFSHSDAIWRDYPELVAVALSVVGISTDASTTVEVERLAAVARARLASSSEAELPEIHAWRRTFSKMGFKPTQYRCAAESLLRRFKKEGVLPRLHPIVDLCNAVSLAFAIPVAVFDVAKVTEYLEVRHATGAEVYLPFSGESEHPAPHEVIFADGAGQAHARRWSHRQSALSAVRNETTTVLIVAEAMHPSARRDMERLTATLCDSLGPISAAQVKTAILSQRSPRFAW